MKLQFQTSEILWATTAVASPIAWFKLYKSMGRDPDLSLALLAMAATIPIWSVFVFLSFAVGRKRVTAAMVVVFAVAQILSLGIAWWALIVFTTPGGG
jgi:bacteriorhodopsin